MRSVPPRFIRSRTYALFFHRFPVVPGAEFWHNCGMPNRAEPNAATPDAVLPIARPESALVVSARTPELASSSAPVSTLTSPTLMPTPTAPANDPNASPRPRDDRAVSEEIPTGEIGGPTGPEPTRFGDWEKKGRCIDF
jgi:hypothetical protein